MSDTAATPMDIRQMLTQFRSLASQEPPVAPPACQTVDWSAPHRLSASAKTQVNLLADRIAYELNATLATLTGLAFNVSCVGVSEHYASVKSEQIERSKPQTYFLPLMVGGSKTPTAYWQIDAPAAGSLISCVLGDPQPPAENPQPLSALSESILSDTLSTLADGLSRALSAASLSKIEPAPPMVYAAWPVKLDGLYELCAFEFKAESETLQIGFQWTCPMELLAPAAGLTPPFGPSLEKKDFSERILRRLRESNAPVEVELGGGIMTVQQLLSLQVGDVLVLDRKVAEPLDVYVHHQLCFTAWPAASGTKLALVFSDVKTRL